MSDKELVEFVKSLPEIRDKDKYVPIKIDDIADKNS